MDTKESKRLLENYLQTDSYKMRNQLFEHLLPTIKKGILAELKKQGYNMTKEEKLSLSFDAFQYCIKHVKKDLNIETHFYLYSSYFTRKYIKKAKKEQNRQILFNEEIHSPHIEQKDIGLPTALQAISNIYNTLEHPYDVIFDDALTSLTLGKKGGSITPLEMSEHHYRKIKDEFKIIIKEILDPDN